MIEICDAHRLSFKLKKNTHENKNETKQKKKLCHIVLQKFWVSWIFAEKKIQK